MMVSKRKKDKGKQNVELFKFFENPSTQKISPKSKNEPEPMIFKLGRRRSTRLKTEIFVENFPETLPDGEYDISKEDFETTDISPLKKKMKISELDDSTNASVNNGKNNDNLEKDESLLESNVDLRDREKIGKGKKSKTNVNDTQQMADNLIDTIDTNAIAEMLKDTSLDSEDGTKRKRKRKYTENSEQYSSKKKTTSKNVNINNSHLETTHLDITPSDSELQTDDFTKEKTKIKKHKNNTELQHSEPLLENTQSSSELQTDNDLSKHKSKSKKKERKSKQINGKDRKFSDLQNETSIKLIDITRSDSELQTDSDLTEKKLKSKKNKHKSIHKNNTKDLKLVDLENRNSSDKFKKPNKKQSDTNSNATDFENLYDNNTNLCLTVSDDDDLENKFKNKENHNIDLENTLYENNPQLSLSVSNGDNDLEKSSQRSSQLEEEFSSNVNKENENINENIANAKSKSKNTSNTNANNLEKSSTNAVTPKKRGRKPKNEKNNILKYFTVQEKQSDQSKELQNETIASNLDESLNKDNSQIAANENSTPISDKTTRSQKSKASNVKAQQDKSMNSDVTPRKRGRPKLEKTRVVKVNVAKEIHKKTCSKLSKVTKEQIKQGKLRKIPKERLEEILEIIDDEDHPIWEDRNISCNPGVHTFWEIRNFKQSELNMKLKYARQFLLRRDWPNLLKILCLYNAKAYYYYPLLAKYAALLLAHTDNDQFDKFIQFLTSMNDSSAVLKKCTKISNNNEE